MSTTAYCEPNFMIITYGEPIKYTSYTTFATDSWDDCVKKCRILSSCVMQTFQLAHLSEFPVNCKLYDVNKVFQLKKLPPSQELLVAFKVVTNICPAIAENPPTFGNQSNYGVASNNMANYTYEISYGALPVCPDGWTMFSRPTTKWCILVIGNPDTMLNYPEAQSYCESLNLTVTGLETTEERDFIAIAGVDNLGPDYPQFAGFWVSGMRKSECYADG
ncbi:Protein CBG11426 [Caenorhabditis briggsae]|uniref:Protein CBG11426 n=1 Tax=Caenorhabditis briggsae TaxID=6238 RepID=A8XD18_CAEBR|nr:Protein CBG11426 [Caenorhabditis briggsae]CAP30536.2 Protein CBG11426 [Caenorhabditis briggsae]